MIILSESSSLAGDNHHKLYDVYVSFQGGNTSHSFVDHLYKALKGANLNTISDDQEIQRGLHLKRELKISIERSRACIIVLSENYASSSFCLDELVLIMTFSYIVIPVFYHVKPKDVRFQINSFGDAMIKHEQKMEAETNVKKRSELANKIEKWKEALRQVADLKGHDANDGPETELIKEILDHIRGRLRGPLRNLIEFGLADIKSATENFAETYLIGSGGYGKVYKAELNLIDRNILLGLDGKNLEKIHMNRKTVAIKHILNDEKGQGKQGFYLEIEMLRRCEHPNIVSLLGYCNEYSEMILIYEFASNGSLDDYLGCIKKVTYLNWNKRLEICLDVANGLDYLHTNITDKERIIHRDIKSANILFD
ncbi:uncharacterized protein [Rutidosis leptorrhynchoides]|uniref:uncharacterized protein n=1 Tax=Rutidosis leptorrhynchoides TaxID=125765 RepID=UPI003A99BB74